MSFLELEVTGRCQLFCDHCYAESGPAGTHGTMTAADWQTVISDAADLSIRTVQFIGGEPTMHPAFGDLLGYALDRGLHVEVFSNLYRVGEQLWKLYAHERVTLATSYYSDSSTQHDAITGRPGSYVRTRANIVEAIGRRIPLRVGIVRMRDDQRVEEARAELKTLGVRDIKVDRVRGVGRANALGTVPPVPSISELCGQCGRGRAAISPDGTLSACVLSRFLPAGNVREEPLGDILRGDTWKGIVKSIPPPAALCASQDGSDCDPASTEACTPAYD
ncbi:radical SAM/SPASM domain-containing protein [Embleya sp. MST-111070]|uniref:radical SAM/SPASM domain-containing protein n=1 Tax=Embleya sp. MST-111070 TaxID=3398231 RepID=UPI003F736C8D